MSSNTSTPAQPNTGGTLDLVFDVGNTETVIGAFVRGELQAHWRIGSDASRTADEYGLLMTQLLGTLTARSGDVRSATLASVVPPLTSAFSDASRRYLDRAAVVIDARTPLPVRLAVDEPLSVGADRIVNTLAAFRLFGQDTLVVDLGTATTYDCVTRDGVFEGGVIAPGVNTAAEQLVSRTAKLPRVELAPPERVIGTRTESCVRSGIFWSAVEAIDGVVRRILAEWQRPNALVVATGGLAPLVAAHCRTVARIDPFLTLRGLWLAQQWLHESGDAP